MIAGVEHHQVARVVVAMHEALRLGERRILERAERALEQRLDARIGPQFQMPREEPLGQQIHLPAQQGAIVARQGVGVGTPGRLQVCERTHRVRVERIHRKFPAQFIEVRT